jgi:CheY-like chemotaxis protein/AraC-like DNA-binding protein
MRGYNSGAAMAVTVRRPRVLAVDDDRSVLDVLHLLLDERYDVVSAPDGESALRRLLSEPVDLVLLDVVMEGLDGITLLQQMRRGGVDVPVVVVSAINTAWTAATAMRLGAVDYITKPFDDAELLDAVDSALHRAAEATDFRPPEDTARILLTGCPVGLGAALAGALAYHARVESIPADAEAIAALPPVSPDVVVLDVGRAPNPHESLLVIRSRFPLAALTIVNAPARARESLLGTEAVGATLLPRPVVLRDLFDTLRVELRPSLHPLPHFSARVVGVIEHLSAHYADLNMRDLGRSLEKSPYYLSRLFRSETGMTLKAYVNRVRVEAARQLLLETSEKIETVATLVGFHDASHLSRQFLKLSGRRPGDYRRTWWDDPAPSSR